MKGRTVSMQLISQAFVTGSEIDDAAVCEAVGGDAVPHDMVVPVSIDADVRLLLETPVHQGGEDSMRIRRAGYAVNDMVGRSVIQPSAIIDMGIGGLR